MNNLSKRGKANSIATFDFSTLYTKIPHHKLIFVLNSLVDFCFNGGECTHIGIDYFGAKWTNEPSKFNIKFDNNTLKTAIKYLLDNSYFKLGENIFRQIIGIPMGSDPAPFVANLFLYFYENKWMLDLKKKDLLLARKLSNIFRFIDDLNATNDNMIFQRSYKDPVGTRKIKHDFSASFLDLDIKIINNKL